MVGKNPVGLQVLEFSQAAEVGERRGIVEQELVGDGIDRFLPRQGQIGVGLKAVLLVSGGKLDADILALGIVEGGQDKGCAELAVVDQVGGLLVVGVDADLQSRQHLLHHADVVDVGPLRPNRTIQHNARFLRCALHQREIGRRGQHLLGRSERSGIAGVEGGGAEWLPGEAEPRTELVLADVGPVLIIT